MASQTPANLFRAMPIMLRDDLLHLNKSGVARALRTDPLLQDVDGNASLSELLFLQVKQQNDNDYFYYYAVADDTLRRIKGPNSSALDMTPVVGAVANTMLLYDEIEAVVDVTTYDRISDNTQMFEFRNFEMPISPFAACRDMFLSQPPVKKAKIWIGGLGDSQHSVYNTDGLRFQDVLDKIAEVGRRECEPWESPLEDEQTGTTQICLEDFFMLNDQEHKQFKEQGYAQCDEEGGLIVDESED